MEKKSQLKRPRKREGHKGPTVLIRKEALPQRIILKALSEIKIK